MIDRVSALDAIYEPGFVGLTSAGGPGVRLQQIRDLRIFQVGAWPDCIGRVRAAFTEALGGTPDPGPGAWVGWGKDGRLARVEPLKWWLIAAGDAASGDAAFGDALPEFAPDVAVGLDLSHSRTGIRISGPSTAELLMRFMAIDFRAASFSRGSIATGSFDHVAATVLRHDTDGSLQFDLLLPRTFAESCWLELVEAAARFGAEVLPSGGR